MGFYGNTSDSGLEKVCVAAMVRAPLSELFGFVNFHLNLGVGRVMLFFDDPNDEGIAILESKPNVDCIPCDRDYWVRTAGKTDLNFDERQVVNANESIKLAKEKDFDWLISIDHDELVYPLVDLAGLLENTKGDILRFTVNEAIPDEGDYDNLFAPRLFKTPLRYIGRLARLLGCRRAYFNGEYFRGHVTSKAAYRVQSKVRFTDPHGPVRSNKSVSVEKTNKVLLLHFDCVGFAAWARKWRSRLEKKSASQGLRGNRKVQFLMFQEASKKGEEGLKELYSRLYLLPKYERAILTLLGLIRKRPIDPQAFRD